METEAKYETETGGVLLGSVNEDGYQISSYVGPGPCAIHKRTSFEPDHDWQLRQIEQQYVTSQRRDRYLGDWHSHLGAAELSRRDVRVLRKIAGFREAQTDTPLMMIASLLGQELRGLQLYELFEGVPRKLPVRILEL